MYSQFINIIYRFYNNNVIIIRKKRRIKKLFKIFVKHTIILSFIIILKKINLFSNHLKNLLNYHYCYYSFL